MPDEVYEITIKDVYVQQLKLEVMLNDVLRLLDHGEDRIDDSDIITVEDPFLDPETGLYSTQYYRKNHPKDEEKG
jgi:predicted membrane-bound spermidine synthase